MVSGLFFGFGFAFGMGCLGAAVLGLLADRTSIDYVCHLIAYLPLFAIVAVLLPKIERQSPSLTHGISRFSAGKR